MGPATLGYFAGPGDFDYHSYLTFHPHQHLINKLGREAKWEGSEVEGRRYLEDGAGTSPAADEV